MSNGSPFCVRPSQTGREWMPRPCVTARGRGMCTHTAAPAHGGRWRAPPAPTACPRAQMRPQSCPPAESTDPAPCLPPCLHKCFFPACLTGTLTALSRYEATKTRECAQQQRRGTWRGGRAWLRRMKAHEQMMYTLIRMAPAGSIHHTVSTCPPDTHVLGTCCLWCLASVLMLLYTPGFCNTVHLQLRAAVLRSICAGGKRTWLAIAPKPIAARLLMMSLRWSSASASIESDVFCSATQYTAPAGCPRHATAWGAYNSSMACWPFLQAIIQGCGPDCKVQSMWSQ